MLQIEPSEATLVILLFDKSIAIMELSELRVIIYYSLMMVMKIEI